MDAPLVSIVMTVYNGEKYLEKAVQSIIEQSYENWELLLADDCSTDGSKDIANALQKKDKRIVCSHNKENQHYLLTRNRLFRETKGSFITLLDADDLMTPDRLEKQLGFLIDHPEYAGCGCFVRSIDANGSPLKTLREDPPKDYAALKEAFKTHNAIVGSTIFIKAQVLKNMGGYSEFFSRLGNEDHDLFSRIIESYKLANLPERLYVYRQFPESTSRNMSTTNFKKFFSGDLVRLFIHQREELGGDWLQEGKLEAIDSIIDQWSKPYLEDPSLFYIKQVEGNIYSGLKREAVVSSLRAIRANPKRWYNYQTFKYALVRWITGK